MAMSNHCNHLWPLEVIVFPTCDSCASTSSETTSMLKLTNTMTIAIAVHMCRAVYMYRADKMSIIIYAVLFVSHLLNSCVVINL